MGTTKTTTTATTTTEKITISPNAHKISYTLNGSEYVDITSENPILMVEDIPVVSNSIDHEPGQPHAAELSSAPYPIPDNIFSQATHQLMKAKKTPTITVSRDVPAQAEENLEDNSGIMLPKPVKRGRYILAATSNG